MSLDKKIKYTTLVTDQKLLKGTFWKRFILFDLLPSVYLEPKNFENLWNWYRFQFEAFEYSGITLDLFIIISQTIPEFSSHSNDRDLFRTLVAQISFLIQSYRYNSTAVELPPITPLISVFINTDCFTNSSSPFTIWTRTLNISNNYTLQEELIVAPPKKDTSSQKTDNSQSRQTHQLRDGKTYTSAGQSNQRRNISNTSTSAERTPQRSSNLTIEPKDNQSQARLTQSDVIETLPQETERLPSDNYDSETEPDNGQIYFNSPYNLTRTEADRIIEEDSIDYPPLTSNLEYNEFNNTRISAGEVSSQSKDKGPEIDNSTTSFITLRLLQDLGTID